MPRWVALLLVAVALGLGLVAALLPLPGVIGPLLYIAAVLCAVAGLIFLFLDVVATDRRPMR